MSSTNPPALSLCGNCALYTYGRDPIADAVHQRTCFWPRLSEPGRERSDTEESAQFEDDPQDFPNQDSQQDNDAFGPAQAFFAKSSGPNPSTTTQALSSNANNSTPLPGSSAQNANSTSNQPAGSSVSAAQAQPSVSWSSGEDTELRRLYALHPGRPNQRLRAYNDFARQQGHRERSGIALRARWQIIKP